MVLGIKKSRELVKCPFFILSIFMSSVFALAYLKWTNEGKSIFFNFYL